MQYKIDRVTFNIIVEPNNDVELFEDVVLSFNANELNKMYQKQFDEYLGRDQEIGIRWRYMEEVKDQLTDLELENPDSDLDFLLIDSTFAVYNLDDIAYIIKLFTTYYKSTSLEPIFNFKCNHPFEFFFIISLLNNIDIENEDSFYIDFMEDYYKYSDNMVKAYRLMNEAGFKHLYNKDLYELMEDHIDMLFDLPLESSELLESLDN